MSAHPAEPVATWLWRTTEDAREIVALVTVYSRPADTQLISWNRFPDTAFAAVSSAPS
jgi:hypothetical protein